MYNGRWHHRRVIRVHIHRLKRRLRVPRRCEISLKRPLLTSLRASPLVSRSHTRTHASYIAHAPFARALPPRRAARTILPVPAQKLSRYRVPRRHVDRRPPPPSADDRPTRHTRRTQIQTPGFAARASREAEALGLRARRVRVRRVRRVRRARCVRCGYRW
jgi:hypothetical protein